MADGDESIQEMNPARDGSEKEAPQEQQDDTQGTLGWVRLF